MNGTLDKSEGYTPDHNKEWDDSRTTHVRVYCTGCEVCDGRTLLEKLPA